MHSNSREAKVVPYFKYCRSIFYFEFFEFGKEYFWLVKFGADLKEIQISNFFWAGPTLLTPGRPMSEHPVLDPPFPCAPA
jgi:hypothetical protein